jgi:tRNA splicing endonuclease
MNPFVAIDSHHHRANLTSMSERGHRARNVRFTLIIVCWTIAIVLFTLAVHHAVLNQ